MVLVVLVGIIVAGVNDVVVIAFSLAVVIVYSKWLFVLLSVVHLYGCPSFGLSVCHG